jgi:hypothetical protein
MLLKLESDRADREFTMMKWKEEAEERRAKEKRQSDERIAAQNMAFQLEIQKLKAQLKSRPGGSST